MDGFYDDDDRPGEVPTAVALEHRSRVQAIIVADLHCLLALTLLELGQRMKKPRMAFQAGGKFLVAAEWYRRAGLGKKAAAIDRLILRCRDAWARFEAAEGFR